MIHYYLNILNMEVSWNIFRPILRILILRSWNGLLILQNGYPQSPCIFRPSSWVTQLRPRGRAWTLTPPSARARRAVFGRAGCKGNAGILYVKDMWILQGKIVSTTEISDDFSFSMRNIGDLAGENENTNGIPEWHIVDSTPENDDFKLRKMVTRAETWSVFFPAKMSMHSQEKATLKSWGWGVGYGVRGFLTWHLGISTLQDQLQSPDFPQQWRL